MDKNDNTIAIKTAMTDNSKSRSRNANPKKISKSHLARIHKTGKRLGKYHLLNLMEGRGDPTNIVINVSLSGEESGTRVGEGSKSTKLQAGFTVTLLQQCLSFIRVSVTVTHTV
jgi:hypothetical protein